MQRLRNSIIKKMFEKKLTGTQVSFLLYISRFQDVNGVSSGIYYKDTCKELGISYQQFYNLLKSLEEKGFIKWEKASRYDYDVRIIDNDWEGQAHKGYVNTNKKLFFNRFFLKMKGSEKLLAMEFQKFIEINACSFHMGVKNLYDKYGKLLGVTKRVIRGYLHTLKRFFSIGIKNGQYYISLRKEYQGRRDGERETEEGTLNENKVKTFCRRRRIKSQTEEVFFDVGRLSVQYRSEADGCGVEIFPILEECIEESIRGSERILNPKSVHALLRQKLNMN